MIEGIPVADLTSGGIVSIFVILLALGKIVPRSVLRDKDEEATRWREAYFTERVRGDLLSGQTGELLESSKTVQKLLEAMYSETNRIRRSGAIDVVSQEE